MPFAKRWPSVKVPVYLSFCNLLHSFSYEKDELSLPSSSPILFVVNHTFSLFFLFLTLANGKVASADSMLGSSKMK